MLVQQQWCHYPYRSHAQRQPPLVSARDQQKHAKLLIVDEIGLGVLCRIHQVASRAEEESSSRWEEHCAETAGSVDLPGMLSQL